MPRRGVRLLLQLAPGYRGIAAKFRREAMQARLARQRQLALSAAERWEALPVEIERAIPPGVALGGKRPDWSF